MTSRWLATLVLFEGCVTVSQPPGPESYGTVFARVTYDTDGPLTYLVFSAELDPTVRSRAPCATATATAGACCYVPPPEPHADATPFLGTFRLDNATSHEALTELEYEPSGGMNPYAGFLLDPASWRHGDTLLVTPGGARVGSNDEFTALVPGLTPPDLAPPPVIARDVALELAWTPDPFATTMALEIFENVAESTSQTIACSVPDASGEISIEPSLLQQLAPGVVGIEAVRETAREVAIADGSAAIASQGAATASVTLE